MGGMLRLYSGGADRYDDPAIIKRSRCAAGHKAMFNKQWGGLPAKDFLAKLDPKLGELRERLYDETYTVETAAGGLTDEWAKKLGLKAGIPVAVGAFDAHLGAVGSGIAPGILVKIIGTSTCDMLVSDNAEQTCRYSGYLRYRRWFDSAGLLRS